MSVPRVIQVVKQHIPLIKFPNRKIPPKSTAGQALPSSQPSGGSPMARPGEYVLPSKLYPTYSKPVGYTPRGSGIDMRDLPAKYRRIPIEQEEIEYIQLGGPD